MSSIISSFLFKKACGIIRVNSLQGVYDMYLDHLDELDQRILTLLTQNARSSCSDIGELVGLSRVAVKSQIDALEKKGIIEEYTTIINPQKISGALSCYFEIEARPEALDAIIDRLYHNDTVTQIYRMSGNCCLHVHAVASSQEELETFLREEIDRLEGTVSVQTHVILARIKDVKGLRL